MRLSGNLIYYQFSTIHVHFIYGLQTISDKPWTPIGAGKGAFTPLEDCTGGCGLL